MSDTPRVWIGCLGCYNDGRLVGDWFDAVDAPTEMEDWTSRVAVAQYRAAHGGAMDSDWTIAHNAEGHEELWVMDHEGFDGLLNGECSPATAKELAETLESLDENERQPYAVYVSAGYDGSDFADAYAGEWDSEEDYAQELAEDCEPRGAFDCWPFMCIDWRHAWRELEYGGDNWSADSGHGTVYIFRGV